MKNWWNISFQELGKFDRLVKSTIGPKILYLKYPAFSLNNIMLQKSVNI